MAVRNNFGVTVGTLIPFSGATIPSGYLECDGSVQLQASYPGLFAAIGTTWNTGGELGTQFRLPSGTGRAFIGAGTYTDTVSGAITRTLGQTLGAEKHVLIGAEHPPHAHAMFANIQSNSPQISSSLDYVAKVADGGGGIGNTDFNYSMAATATAATIGRTGLTIGGNSHNNMQPSLVGKWIIKY